MGEAPSVDVVGRIKEMGERHGSKLFEGKLILGDPKLAIDTVKAIRETLGSNAMIRLDSNMQRSLPAAIRVFLKIEPYDIRNYEVPVATFEEMAELLKHSSIRMSTCLTMVHWTISMIRCSRVFFADYPCINPDSTEMMILEDACLSGFAL